MKTMSIITSVLALLGISSCADFKTVEPEDFETSIADMGAQIVDVRTPEEFAEGHIARAVNIDVSGANFLEKAEAKLDKSKPVALYCRSGKRSAKAARILSRKGFDVINLDGGIIAWKDAGKHIMADSPYEVDSFPTKSGKHVWINALMHASIWIQYDGLNIYVDPVRTLGERKVRYDRLPKADLALVTHEHADHFDKELLDSLNTKVVTNRRCAEMLVAGEIMANGDKMDLREDIRIEAVPAYNTTEGREKFHPKGRDNGYILTLDGLRIYIAGDTEDIPEMADIKDIDIAFLPCNQPYTMTPEQLVKAAKTIAPKVVFPYHYSSTDVSGIKDMLTGINVKIRQYQ